MFLQSATASAKVGFSTCSEIAVKASTKGIFALIRVANWRVIKERSLTGTEPVFLVPDFLEFAAFFLSLISTTKIPSFFN
jgi:hypothetical protein